MKRIVPAAALLLVVSASPAFAADKTHQQIMAEIRMMQEQQQQLQQLVAGLAETLKVVTTKLDEQSGATRKAFADQKVLIDNVADGVRVLREKADDTNVRLSSLTQEVETLRQTIASMPVPSAAPPVAGTDVPPGTQPPVLPSTTTGAINPPPAGVSAQRMYDSAWSDYTGGQYELAIETFTRFIEGFPNNELRDDAQLNIANSYYSLGRFKEAADAAQKVITDYPQSNSVPAAYYKLGQAYEALKQIDLAKKAYETGIQRYPSTSDAQLMKQRLDALNRR
jgi:tol-pal system protein YbgF